jgi:hypothetical protein
VTSRDLVLIGFAARHRFVLASHVNAWLGADRSVGYRRLAGLVDLGLLAYQKPFHHLPGSFSVTRPGLELIGSQLAVPLLDLACYRHDAALVWLWLKASAECGALGRELLTEREMRAGDRRSAPDASKFGLEVYRPDRGRAVRHFADLIVVDAAGRREATELELTQKSRGRLEGILLAYAAEPAIATVTYITDRAAIAASVHQASYALGVTDRVTVRLTSQPVVPTRPLGSRLLSRPQLEEMNR